MFNTNLFVTSPAELEDRLAKWQRLLELRDELEQLRLAREGLLRRLHQMRRTLDGQRRESAEIRARTRELIARIIRRLKESPGSTLTPEEEQQIAALDAWRQRLENEIADMEQQLKVAAFEAESLEASLNEVQQQVDQLAAEMGEDASCSQPKGH
jgi:chromosome segregation ATPase